MKVLSCWELLAQRLRENVYLTPTLGRETKNFLTVGEDPGISPKGLYGVRWCGRTHPHPSDKFSSIHKRSSNQLVLILPFVLLFRGPFPSCFLLRGRKEAKQAKGSAERARIAASVSSACSSHPNTTPNSYTHRQLNPENEPGLFFGADLRQIDH
jgi:hypothetical protein